MRYLLILILLLMALTLHALADQGVAPSPEQGTEETNVNLRRADKMPETRKHTSFNIPQYRNHGIGEDDKGF